MTVILMLLGFVTVARLEAAGAGTFHRDYLAPGRTRYWKGLCVLLILMSHYTGYINTTPGDESYLMFRQWSGQSLVVLFFFYSGYGMTVRAMENVRGYLRRLPGRFVRVWVTCAASVAVMLLVQVARGRDYMLSSILLAFVPFANIGNSTWYIFAILVLYLLLALSLVPAALKKSSVTRWLYPVLLTVLTLAFIAWMQWMELDEYWYDTVLLFPLGAWWAMLHERLEKWMQRSDLTWSAALLVTLTAAVYFFSRQYESFVLHECWMAATALALVVLSMKVTPCTPLLGFCGDHVLPIYLFQRIPMIALYESGLLDPVPHLSFAVVLAAAAAIALLYDRIAGAISLKWTRKN